MQEHFFKINLCSPKYSFKPEYKDDLEWVKNSFVLPFEFVTISNREQGVKGGSYSFVWMT